MLNTGFIKYLYKLRKRERGYFVLVDYQSLFANLVPLTLPQLSFSVKCRRNKLQLVNKSTEILRLATSHIAHLCNQFSHVFALLISMLFLTLKSINFYQDRAKIKLFSPKNAKCLSAGGSAWLHK